MLTRRKRIDNACSSLGIKSSLDTGEDSKVDGAINESLEGMHSLVETFCFGEGYFRLTTGIV